MKRKKIKILIWVLAVCILLLTGSLIVWQSIQSASDLKLHQQAQEAYQSGDFKKAQELYFQILLKDNNNETAAVRLGEILERDGYWHDACRFRRIAIQLNGLEVSYQKAYVNCMLMARDFPTLASYYDLRLSKGNSLNLEEQVLRIYGLLADPKTTQLGKDAWKTLAESQPDCVDTTWGKLLRLAFFSADMSIEEARALLDELICDDSTPVRQEALITYASLMRLVGLLDECDKHLATLCELNFSVGMPIRGEFLANTGKYAEAVDVLEAYLDRFFSPRLASSIGELMLLADKTEKLDALEEKVHNQVGSDAIISTYYIASLKAFHAMEYDSLAKSISPIRDALHTPIGFLMAMMADVAENDPVQLAKDYQALLELPPLLDFQKRGTTIAGLFLTDCLSAGMRLADLTRIVELLTKADPDFQDDPHLARLAMLTKLYTDTLSERDIQAVMEHFTNQPDVMEVAVCYYYFRKKPDLVIKIAREMEAIPHEGFQVSQVTKRIIIDTLIQQDEIEEAAQRFDGLLGEKPSEKDLQSYWVFATRFNRVDDLRKILAFPTELSAKYQTLCKATLAFHDGQIDDGIKMLLDDDTFTENRLLEYKGYLLATYDKNQEALDIFLKISEDYPNRPLVLKNLSLLYAKLEQPDKAEECISKAYTLSPADPDIQLVYVQTMLERKEWRKILACIQMNDVTRAPKSLKADAWRQAMLALATEELEAKHYQEAQQYAEMLLHVDSGNAIAKEIADQCTEAMK